MISQIKPRAWELQKLQEARLNLNKDLGLRHRSALGLSQETDAKIIIISEERGRISFAYRGEIHQDITTDELQLLLED